jgi:hypothetical protein
MDPNPTVLVLYLDGDLEGDTPSGPVTATTDGSFVTSETADSTVYGFGEGGFGDEPFGGTD